MKIIVLLPYLLFFIGELCSAWSAELVRVIDGDTLIARDIAGKTCTIRLYGIDAPELRQEYGREARAFVQSLLNKMSWDSNITGTDRYKRTLAIVRFVEGATLQAALLQAGYAWVYPQYCTIPLCQSWRKLEQAARQSQRGLWRAVMPSPPWIWRKSRVRKKLL